MMADQIGVVALSIDAALAEIVSSALANKMKGKS